MNSKMITRKSINLQKGVTLIALVITIIVLLILAGVTINMVLGDEGIIAQAESAQLENRGGAVEEKRNKWKLENDLKNEYGASGNVQELEGLLQELEENKLITADEREQINETGEVTIGSRTIIFKQNIVQDIILEVNEYVNGYNLICIYTNDENVAYALDGFNLYDITDSGYTYNGQTYNKVYGYVTNEEKTAEDFTILDASTVEIEEVIYDYDINYSGDVIFADAMVIQGFIDGHEEYYENIRVGDMINKCLKSDVNRDKRVTTSDYDATVDYIEIQIYG